MNDLIARIGKLLKEEAEIYNDILGISKQKTSIIVEGKVAELDKIVKMEQAFIFKISDIEDEREALVAELSGIMGQKPETLTISKIADFSEEKDRTALKETQKTMTGLINQLRASNELNAKLIRNSLDYIDFSMGLFTSMGSEDNNYNPRAVKSAGKSRNLFDLKI